LHVDQPVDGNIINRKVISSRYVVCASPNYLSERGMPATPDDLLEQSTYAAQQTSHISFDARCTTILPG
jgi:hypothetical protein